MHLPGKHSLFFPFLPPQPFLGVKGGIWGTLQLQASMKMSEGKTSGEDGLSIIKCPATSLRYRPPLSTKAVSKPQSDLGETPAVSQAKEQSL